MTDLFMRKTLTGLMPADDSSSEVLDKLRLGCVVQVKVSQPRNIQHHRLFFALVNKVFENQEIYPSRAALRAALTVAAGHAELVKLDKSWIYVPKSIAFHKMDQTEFNDFFNRVCNVVCEKIIPNLDEAELRQEISQMVGASS